jgi:hypothetical protein
LYNPLDNVFDRPELSPGVRGGLNGAVSRLRRGERTAGRAPAGTRPRDGAGGALRAALERRLADLRVSAERLGELPPREVHRESSRLLARIDAQLGDWLAEVPALLGGRGTAELARSPAYREHQRALRKLAVLRADVLHAARRGAGGASG